MFLTKHLNSFPQIPHSCFSSFWAWTESDPVGPMLRIGNSGEAHSSLLFQFSGFSGNWGCYRPTRFSFTQMASSGNFWFVIEGEAILQRICFYACLEALCLSCEFSNWVVYVTQLCFICAVIYIDFGVGFNTKFQHRLNHSMCVCTRMSPLFFIEINKKRQHKPKSPHPTSLV